MFKIYYLTLILLVTSLFTLFSSNVVFGQQEATSSQKTTFEAFWPLTAGRTMGDPLYSLKIFKENLRGFLVFGSPQKADYAVFIGTKRVLEADKLISDGNKDLADKTLEKAAEQFDIAARNINDAKPNKRSLGNVEYTIKPRLENLIILMSNIQTNKAGTVLQKIKDLKGSI